MSELIGVAVVVSIGVYQSHERSVFAQVASTAST